MKFLIVEDDEDKLIALEQSLRERYLELEIVRARSFASGLKAAIGLRDQLSAILLDMSMPNFDIAPQEPSGGNPEPFAGRELLAQLKLRGVGVPTVVVTMFDSFAEKGEKISLAQLSDQLLMRYSPPYVATIYFNPRQEGWKAELLEVVSGILQK